MFILHLSFFLHNQSFHIQLTSYKSLFVLIYFYGKIQHLIKIFANYFFHYLQDQHITKTKRLFLYNIEIINNNNNNNNKKSKQVGRLD